MPGESIRFTTKEAEKKVTKKVKVIKEYSLFVLVEVSGLEDPIEPASINHGYF